MSSMYSALVSIKIKKQISMDSGRPVLSSIHGTVQKKGRERLFKMQNVVLAGRVEKLFQQIHKIVTRQVI